MEKLLHIQSITKQELKSIIEEAVESKITSLNKSNKPENLSVQSCAKLLSVSELTIYSYIRKGIIPAKRIGRKYIINSTELENVLKEVKSLKYKRNV